MNILSTSAKEMNRRHCCVLSVIVGPEVPRAGGHRPQPTLSSLWAPLEGLRAGSRDGLHKVVGDLPLVLKQVLNLCTVCITCMTSIHISSVAIIFAPASHDVVHKVRLSHVH